MHSRTKLKFVAIFSHSTLKVYCIEQLNLFRLKDTEIILLVDVLSLFPSKKKTYACFMPATFKKWIKQILKRQCHEIFDLYFFHEWNPSGPLINRLKWFCFKIRFRQDIRIRNSQNSTPRSVILRKVKMFWQASPLKC